MDLAFPAVSCFIIFPATVLEAVEIFLELKGLQGGEVALSC